LVIAEHPNIAHSTYSPHCVTQARVAFDDYEAGELGIELDDKEPQ